MEIQNIINDDCPYTKFPIQVDNIDRKIDVSLELIDLIDQYEQYYQIKDFESAAKLLEYNPRLKQCTITQEDLNKLRDGLIAVQRMFLEYISEYLITFSKPKGEWSKSITYQKYNIVTHTVDGVTLTYVAMPKEGSAVPVGTVVTDKNYWTCITLRGEKGDSGLGLTVKGLYKENTQYAKDDFVVYGNKFWSCNEGCMNQIPNKESPYWTLLMEFASDFFTYNNENSTLVGNFIQEVIDELDKKCVNLDNRINKMQSMTTITLNTNAWSSTYPFYQTLSVPNITSIDNFDAIKIVDGMNVTEANIKAYNKAFGLLMDGVTGDGTITIYAYKKPAINFSVGLKGV